MEHNENNAVGYMVISLIDDYKQVDYINSGMFFENYMGATGFDGMAEVKPARRGRRFAS
jgi:hypothetical protein